MNWKNLGGAIAATGTSLIGVGVLTQLTQLSPNTANILTPSELSALWYVALAGFIMSCVGKGMVSFFSADTGTVKDIANVANNAVDAVNKINQQGPSTDTEVLSKTKAPPSAK